MRYSFDPAKAAANIAKHGVAFLVVESFEWEWALVRADVRFDYAEPRMVALAPVGTRLNSLVFSVERRTIRIISLRKASTKEIRLYEAQI
jgi:uncharacterized DUF497 family protein